MVPENVAQLMHGEPVTQEWQRVPTHIESAPGATGHHPGSSDAPFPNCCQFEGWNVNPADLQVTCGPPNRCFSLDLAPIDQIHF